MDYKEQRVKNTEMKRRLSRIKEYGEDKLKNNNLVLFMQSSQQSLSCGLRLESIYLYLDMPCSINGSQEHRGSINTCTIINTSLASTAQAALVQHAFCPSASPGKDSIIRESTL